MSLLELAAVSPSLVLGSEVGPLGEKGTPLTTEPSLPHSLLSARVTVMFHHARLVWHFDVLCTVGEGSVLKDAVPDYIAENTVPLVNLMTPGVCGCEGAKG